MLQGPTRQNGGGVPGTRDLKVITWNCRGLRGKLHSLRNLLEDNNVDVALITETELSFAEASIFTVGSYKTFLPNLGIDESKVRVMAFVAKGLCVNPKADIIETTPMQSIWLGLSLPEGGGSILIGGFYRQFSSITQEGSELAVILDQIRRASEHKRVVLLGDFNLNMLRVTDPKYSRRPLLDELLGVMETGGLEYLPTATTWKSSGLHFKDGAWSHRVSCLDHIYVAGVLAEVKLLRDAASDHLPLLASIRGLGCRKRSTKKISRRNFKSVLCADLEWALKSVCDWSLCYSVTNVDDALAFIVSGITAALDIVAPLKVVTVKEDGNLLLARDTRLVMAARDNARAAGLISYKQLRNRASSLLKRDQMRTNSNLIKQSKNDPKVLWRLANLALGKEMSGLLPSLKVGSLSTRGDVEAAAVMNKFLIHKVDDLRQSIPVEMLNVNNLQPRTSVVFEFSFVTAGKIAAAIKGLKNTGALGYDGIPVSVLKKGVEVLAGPVAFLVNLSLASGKVPSDFKVGRVHPIHKGKGKPKADPGSYRPVSILSSLSKVLETIVLADLSEHFSAIHAIPDSQWGFRQHRSTSSALASAHASWIRASKAGKVVGILAFDLSAAFDTVSAAQLLPKLKSLGISGTRLDWFCSYLNGGYQSVVWNNTASRPLEVKFGVRQGSLLGPSLFLALVSDMETAIGANGELMSYADDTCTWVTANNYDELKTALEDRATAFARFAGSCGLVMNPSKTQLLLVGKAKPDSFSMIVDGTKVSSKDELELLGVTFDCHLNTTPYEKKLVKAAKLRSAMIAQLAHHIPRGRYLRQLAFGLFFGKVSYSVAAFARPRLDTEDPPHSSAIKSVEVAVNDVARSLTGLKRTDRITLEKLHKRARIPTFNQVVIKSVVSECWRAFTSRDGINGQRNMLGMLMFGPVSSEAGSGDLEVNEGEIIGSARVTRSAADGKIPIPLRGENTFTTFASSIWNTSTALRAATSKSEAMDIARSIASTAPWK